MDIIKKIHRQQLKIKHEKKMIPTDLGRKIIRNFKVPKRNHKHRLERYMKTTRRGNELHKKGDVKYRRVRDYEDFVKNYNLILKINNSKSNGNTDINAAKLKRYKQGIKDCEIAFGQIEDTLNIDNLKDVQPSINQDVKELNKYKRFSSKLKIILGVSTDNELLRKIESLQDNSNLNNKKNIHTNQNTVNADDNDDSNSDSDQHPKYYFGKV